MPYVRRWNFDDIMFHSLGDTGVAVGILSLCALELSDGHKLTRKLPTNSLTNFLVTPIV